MGVSKNLMVAVLCLGISGTALAASRGKNKNQAKNETRYVLAFNQLLALPAPARSAYLRQLQDAIAQFSTAKGQEKSRKGAGIRHPLWHLLIEEGHAATPTPGCVNLGYVDINANCDPNFSIAPERYAAFQGTAWGAKLSCPAGEQLCNPALFGPGVCAGGNDTSRCIVRSRRTDSEAGIRALEAAMKSCSPGTGGAAPANADTKLCEALNTGYNDVTKFLSEKCQGNQAEKCLRLGFASETRENVRHRVDVQTTGGSDVVEVPPPADGRACRYYGEPQVLRGCGNGGQPRCIGYVENCADMVGRGTLAPLPEGVPESARIIGVKPQDNMFAATAGNGPVECPATADGKCPPAHECLTKHVVDNVSGIPAQRVIPAGTGAGTR